MASSRNPTTGGARRAACSTALLCILLATCGQEAPGPAEPAVPAAETAPASEGPAPATTAPARPNIVLVTVDTLRADRLSCYGHDRDTSPFLDALAREGVLFERAYAPSSWTVPSMVSLFSSRYPISHGVTHGGIETVQSVRPDGVVKQSEQVIGQQVMPEALGLLPEFLRRAGYRTFASVTNMHLDREQGFARGFDHFHHSGWDDASVVRLAAQRWSAQLEEPAPYFLWVHVFDPHGPYNPRGPWIQDYYPEYPDTAGLPTPLHRPEDFADTVKAGSPQLEFMNALYDSEVAYTDAQLSQLMSRLGVDSEDLVIVLSDHGEEFREHGAFGHAHSVYEELIRIPLIIRFPGRRYEGRRVRGLVSSMDILPTLLDYLDVETPDDLDGRSFLPLLTGETQASGPIYAHLDRVRRMSAIIDGDWKYVHGAEDGNHMLFDLGADPAERNNRIKASPEIALGLQRRLLLHEGTLREDTEQPGQRILSKKEIEQLRALGYLN